MREVNEPKALMEELIGVAVSDLCLGHAHTAAPGYFISRLSPEKREIIKQLTVADCNNIRTDWFDKFVSPVMRRRR